MGLEWSLEQIEKKHDDDSEGKFYPESFSPFDLDRILVGKDEGPVSELVESGVTECDHDRPDIDWSSHCCPPAIIPNGAVRRCAASVSHLTRPGYASPETVLAGINCDRIPWVEQAIYEELAGLADEFRRFVVEPAERGYDLRCWMH